MFKEKQLLKRTTTILIAFMVAISMTAVTADEVYGAAKPAKVTISSVKSADHNAVKITWKKAKNAKKYQVYRATSKNGRYKLVRTTTARTFTNTGLATGRTYYYKVRAYKTAGGKTRYGAYSTKFYASPKLGTTAASASVKENSITVSWKKVSGASRGIRVLVIGLLL